MDRRLFFAACAGGLAAAFGLTGRAQAAPAAFALDDAQGALRAAAPGPSGGSLPQDLPEEMQRRGRGRGWGPPRGRRGWGPPRRRGWGPPPRRWRRRWGWRAGPRPFRRCWINRWGERVCRRW